MVQSCNKKENPILKLLQKFIVKIILDYMVTHVT